MCVLQHPDRSRPPPNVPLVQVVWTGRSSLDIRMQLTQAGAHPPDEPSLVAVFSFVSLANAKPSPVPQLTPATEGERGWFEERQAVADARRAQRAAAAAAGGSVEGGYSVRLWLCLSPFLCCCQRE